MVMERNADTVAAARVDVIMTVYNGEDYVAEAIESILAQTLADFEFTIVDDGSDDGTAAILERAERDSRVRVIRSGRLGRARALNVAWKNGRAPYVANLDADDRSEPLRLERQLEYLREHPQVGMLGTAARLEFVERNEERIRQPEEEDDDCRYTLLRRSPFVHSSVMIPRRVLEAVGGYNESYPRTVDHELAVRIARRYPVANLPDLLTIKRVTPTQYFRSRLQQPGRHWTQIKLRWKAWWTLSRRPQDLRYVIETVFALVGAWFRRARGRKQAPAATD